MKHTLKKISNVFIIISAIFSNTILFWVILSVAEVAILGTTGQKASEYNMFTLSQSIRNGEYHQYNSSSNEIYTDEITDDSEDDCDIVKIKSLEL